MLSRNYSTRNFFYQENGNNNKIRYEFSTFSTCNSLNLDKSSELDRYKKEKFYDNDLANRKKKFFCNIDTDQSQEKELEDFDNETNSKINEINDYYSNEKKQFKYQYETKINEIIKNYLHGNGIYDDDDDEDDYFLEKKYKLKNKYNSQCDAFLEEIEIKRKKVIEKYKKKRNFQRNQLKKNHKNVWDLEV